MRFIQYQLLLSSNAQFYMENIIFGSVTNNSGLAIVSRLKVLSIFLKKKCDEHFSLYYFPKIVSLKNNLKY